MDLKKKLDLYSRFLKAFLDKVIATMDARHTTIDYLFFSQVVSDKYDQELFLIIE